MSIKDDSYGKVVTDMKSPKCFAGEVSGGMLVNVSKQTRKVLTCFYTATQTSKHRHISLCLSAGVISGRPTFRRLPKDAKFDDRSAAVRDQVDGAAQNGRRRTYRDCSPTPAGQLLG
jgi:hypothetical protein